jgi:paraquat-inducible protein B
MELNIPVFIEIYPDRIGRKGAANLSQQQRLQNFQKLIDQGLRARLEVQSFVTGQLMISLNFHPSSPVRLVGDGSILEIPTLPSTFEELSRTLQNIEFEEIMDNLNKTIAGVERIVSSARVDQITLKVNDVLAEVNSSLDNLSGKLGVLIDSSNRMVRGIDTMVSKIDTRVEPTFSSLNQTLESAGAAARQADALLREVKGSVADDSLVMTELTATLRNLSAAARSVRALADYMERHPEAFISGKGGY